MGGWEGRSDVARAAERQGRIGKDRREGNRLKSRMNQQGWCGG